MAACHGMACMLYAVQNAFVIERVSLFIVFYLVTLAAYRIYINSK